ncbi:hypothetical protein [Aquimarina litoralis]|uniref:hypothetical protein n=1 Tax=Aquimarina litoralis TaxID=584605 RepID=UPI001C58C369|nr:hypothetical protein [Aquimarina litoralis]MBW1296371.1 hypothetical protein [Aquimarina litoralis]
MKKSNYIVLLFTLIFLSGYSQSIDRLIDQSIKVDSLNVPKNSHQSYFPKELVASEQNNNGKKFDSTSILNPELRFDLPTEWYSEYLYAMKEPLLFNRKTEKQIYRFTWLRTFDKPMTFRIEKWRSRYILYWKVLSGKGGYDSGELERTMLKILSEKEWIDFIDLINKADFWNMKLGRSFTGTDGSEWIMEGVDPNNYRVVTVWSPTEGYFYEACNYLISLTDLNISEKKKY